MKTKLFYTAFLSIALVALTALPSLAQLRYQTQYSKSKVSGIISRLETSSDKFRRDFDRAMDNSRRNNTNAEDRYNDNVRDFENSLDELRREFNRTRSWWETRNQVQEVVNDGQTVNQMMNQISFRRTLERQWNAMRSDLNTLADTYDLPGLNGGGWTGGNNGGWNGGGNNGQQMAPPSWARGTFYGTAPNGSQITLTISNDGAVTANINGSMSYGTFTRGNRLNMGGSIANVTRNGDGLTTTRTDNGERIVYGRSSWGGGNNNDGDRGNGTQVRPPSWAQGTFYGTAPNGTPITLTIDANGRVSAQIGQGTSFGSFTAGNYLNMDGAIARVTRNGNGITTTRTDNGERIDYRR